MDVSNIPCVNTKVSELVCFGTPNRLIDRRSMRIHCSQSDSNLSPLSKVSTATASTVEHTVTFFHTATDQVEFVFVVRTAHDIHGVSAISS